MRMSRLRDIGVQAGILSRVQHILEAKQEEQQPSTSSAYLEVRRSMKQVSTDPTMKGRPKSTSSLQAGAGSGSSTSTHSLHEGEEEEREEIDPQLIARHGRFWERQQTVGDLRSRLERAQAELDKKATEKESKRPRED